jgi:hypothetical protein
MGTSIADDSGRNRCSKCPARPGAGRPPPDGHGEGQQHARDGGVHPGLVHQRIALSLRRRRRSEVADQVGFTPNTASESR